jgi:hypothetical protein
MSLAKLKTFQERKEHILERIEARQLRCKDEKVNLGRLYCDSTDNQYSLRVETPPGVNLTEYYEDISILSHAETQLLARLKIPASYIHRCPQHLRARNINYWIGEKESKDILLRWIDDDIRAIFSTRFSPDLDDHKLFPLVLSVLEETATAPVEDTLHLKDFCQTADFSLFKALFKDARTEYDGTVYFAGVVVVNSEVGRSSVWIRPMIRSGHTGGAWDFIDCIREGTTVIRHVGQLSEERIRNGIINAREVSEVGVHQLLKAGKQQVENPRQTVKDLIEDSDFLPKRLLHIIEEQYQEDQRTTKLLLAQSMLEALRELPLFKRHLAEGEIGRYLDLFRNSKQRLSIALKDIQEAEARG